MVDYCLKQRGTLCAFGVDVYNKWERCECLTALYFESTTIYLRNHINRQVPIFVARIASPTSRLPVLYGAPLVPNRHNPKNPKYLKTQKIKTNSQNTQPPTMRWYIQYICYCLVNRSTHSKP